MNLLLVRLKRSIFIVQCLSWLTTACTIICSLFQVIRPRRISHSLAFFTLLTGAAAAASPGCTYINAGAMNYSGPPLTAGLLATTREFYAGDEIRLAYTTTPAKTGVTLNILHTSISLGLVVTGSATSYSISGVIGSTGVALLQAGYVDATALATPANRVTVALTCIPAPAPTTLAVTATASQSVYGQPVDFQATATSIGGTPSGNVVFSIDGVQQTAVPLVSGVATLSRSDLDVGNHTVSANFLGSTNFGTANATLTGGHRVNIAPTTTTLTATNNATTYGQSTTLTAQVSANAPSTAPPTGTMIFSIDGADQAPVTLSNGTATLPISTMAAGARSITARYVATTTHAASTSAIVPITVSQAGTATALTLSPNPSTFGQSVTVTAAVSSAYAVPSGNVVFTVAGVAQAPVPLTNGSASISASSLAVGTQAISATYHPTGNFITSSASASQQVNQAPTSIALTDPGAITYGQSATFNAQVTSSGGTPTGTLTFEIDGVTQTPVPLVAGAASFTAPGLAGGTHTVKAHYNGATNFSPSDATLTGGQLVNPAATATALTLGSPTSHYGDTISVTARVTSAAGSPSGTVIFSIDGVPGPSATLTAGEAATTLSGLAFGARNITAAFQATTSFSASTSATASHLVTQAPASLSVTASPEPTVSGQSVTFTAQVSSTGGVPTGSVIFTIDGTATTVPLTNGRATIPRADLPVGNHAVAVAYGGDTNFLATSATLPGGHTVNRAATTTTLSAPASTGTFGAPLTLTADIAAVAPGIGTPAGSVIFSLNGAPQPAQPLTNGKATLTLGALAVNTYAITAVYSGDGAFLQSTGSLSGGYDVRAADTALVLTAQPEPSRFGDEVTLRAEVTSSGGTPTGSVIFTVDGQVLPAENLQSGIATAKVTGLAVPSTPITAIYQGAASFNASPLASISHIVNLAQTSVSITSSAPAVTLGEDVTFTVTVHSPAGTPTGKIDILYGSTVIADDIDLVGGSASFTHSLPTGTHTITAIYAGDTKFEPSTGTLSGGQKVNPSAVTLALSTSANPIAYGQPGTISVTLTSAGGVPSGGNVTFTIDGADYPAPLTNGLATLSLPTLEPGLYPITASYAGSSDFLAVSSTMTNGLTIQRAPANLTLTPPAPTAVYGDSIVVEASVASGSLSPTGTVTFSVDGVPRAPVTLANGLATLDLAGLGVGSHAITATYSGDSHIAQASATLSGNVVITPAAATMTLSATPPTAEFGGPIELVADLGSGAGTPAGTVVFTVGGTAYPAVTLVSGKARLILDALTVGSNPVSAAFAAQKNHAAIGATLAAPLVVTHKTTNLVLTSSGPTEVGETATFRAQLSAGSLSPTGAIKFIFDGDPSSAVTATMSNGVATYSRAFAAGGTHQVDAVFAGDLEFAPAAAALLGGQVVSAADTELRLSASPASPAFGDHVTVTASVSALSASAGTPSGLVEFSLDGAVLGRSALAAGSASFDLPVLSAGTHRIRADYIASRDHAASFAEISSFAVARAAPTVTLSASPNPAVAGAPVTIEVHVSSPAGIPSGSVTLTGLGTYSLDASGILAFAPTFAAGSYAIEAHFLGDDDFAPSTSAQVSLQVDPPPVAVSFLVHVPTGTVGESYHGSISAVGGTGTYSVSADANFPQGLNLDPTTGEITGIPAAAGTFSFDITATNGLTAPVVQTFSIIVLDPVTVSSASLPNGVAGASYLSAPLTAAGGTAPYIFALSGAPSGITLNGSNEIAGTTTQTGSFDFVVTATDANGAIGVQTYRVTFEAPTIQLVTSIPAGEVGMPYQGSVTASGGAGSLTISVSTGQLPPGLHLDPDTCDITGIPTAAGSYPVTFTAEDDNGFTGTASATFVTAIVPVITLPTSLPPGRENRFYSQSLAATGATAPYTYTITSGALPTGFGLDSGTGLLSGTPTVSGPVDFTITVTDSAGTTPAVQRYTFTIAAASTLTMNTPATVPGGLPYTHDFAAAGGSGNYTYRIVSGTLPLGLAFDPAGTISGVATEAGAFGLIVEVTDTTSGDKFTKNFVLDVEAPIISVTASSTSATFDMAYSATLTALGGQGTYTYSSPNLPAWLSFGSADTIIGTPPLAGSITFDILAEDANGFTGTTPITLVIAPPDIDLGALSDLAHQTTRPYSASFPVTGGVGPYSFRVTSGNLPPGITLAAGTAAQGTLSGTPTVAGTFTFTIEAEDANQFVGETSYTIVITSHLGSAQLPAILSTWVAGEAGTATAGVTNDASTFVYTSVGLPAGLELDDRTGEITGTLDSVGDYALTIIATKDSNGLENSRSYAFRSLHPRSCRRTHFLPAPQV